MRNHSTTLLSVWRELNYTRNDKYGSLFLGIHNVNSTYRYVMKAKHYTLSVVIACLLALGCENITEPIAEDSTTLDPIVTNMNKAADVESFSFSVPAPPIPVVVSCLEEDLRGEGTWNGWVKSLVTSSGHLHTTEYIDYSEVFFRGLQSGQVWEPAPGAHENLISNFPIGEIITGATAIHEINARYLGPEGYPDLLIKHSIHRVWDANGQLRVDKIVIPFVGKCIGNVK